MSYDATSEPNEFVGDSREEAISNAASFYGVEESELRIAEPADVFNAGARVVVVAVPKDVKPRKPRARKLPARAESRARRNPERMGLKTYLISVDPPM